MGFLIPTSWILIGLLIIIAVIIVLAIFCKRARPAPDCQPFSQIVVSAFAPGTEAETVECTSNKAFLVYCSTNFPPSGVAGYSVSVKSTGFGSGTVAPTYIVGAQANDVITFSFTPGMTGFLTLQTECDAKASISG
jgi:hypothetical protein